MISGFLITGILIERFDKPIDIKRFYLRRFFKIYPHYLFVLIFAFLFIFIKGYFKVENHPAHLSHFLSYFFFIQNYVYIDQLHSGFFTHLAHTWSLAVEEHFYLLYPLIVSCVFALIKSPLKRRSVLILLSLVCIIATVYYRRVSISVEYLVFYQMSIVRMDGLMMGCLLKFLEPFIERHNVKDSLWLGSVYFILALFAYFYFIVTGHYSVLVAGLGAVSLFMSAFKGFKPFVRVLENSIMRWIGKNSYGIYLWHLVVVGVLISFKSSMNLYVMLLMATGLSFFMGWLTTSTIERYFLSLRKKIVP